MDFGPSGRITKLTASGPDRQYSSGTVQFGLVYDIFFLNEAKIVTFLKTIDGLGPFGQSCDQTGPRTAVLLSGTVRERSGPPKY